MRPWLPLSMRSIRSSWRVNKRPPARLLTGLGLLLCAGAAILAGCASSPQAKGSAPTPIAEGPLASIVAPVMGSQVQRIVTSYDTSTQQAKITLTIAAAPDVATAQARVKALCFAVEKAVWTSRPSVREVKVIVLGPLYDDYANIIEDAYGVSDVFAPTAVKLSWPSLSPESAWGKYDGTWLRPTFKPNWIYGKNN
ncbi:MAG TPA: hypothetical protein VF040_17820 [Ktedonobacterales bacterium]